VKTNTRTRLLSLLAAVAVAGPLLAQPAPKDFTKETPAERDARMGWFRDARFGMFIHWGVYSVPAGEFVSTKDGQSKTNKGLGEWYLEESKMPVSEYEKFAGQFNPVKFDAKAWALTARNAGMKYLVITSKHHDGFGMYRSELTDWCMKSTPFPRDPLKELAAACQEEGITFCLYHSIMDWHHPDWGTRRKWNDKVPATAPDMDRYTAYMKGQLKELLTGYGPIGIVWFDGEWESPWTHDRGVDLYNYCRSLQPKTIVNNRVGKGRAGMNGMDKGQGVGDYGTPEQEIPATGFGAGVDWESCMTMNGHWGYNKNDQNWKSAKTLIQNLVNCASKGGNYLLNVGPTSEGLIPGPSIERLAEMGAWMKANGEAIYGTTASPFKKLAWGKSTQKPGKLFRSLQLAHGWRPLRPHCQPSHQGLPPGQSRPLEICPGERRSHERAHHRSRHRPRRQRHGHCPGDRRCPASRGQHAHAQASRRWHPHPQGHRC
jgi:alpha-L-fucosidase